MKELAPADIERRFRRLERQNRILVVLLGVALALGSIAASNAQPTLLTADEVRAHRFILVDPNGGIADDWSVAPNANASNMTRNIGGPYSQWPFHRP